LLFFVTLEQILFNAGSYLQPRQFAHSAGVQTLLGCVRGTANEPSKPAQQRVELVADRSQLRPIGVAISTSWSTLANIVLRPSYSANRCNRPGSRTSTGAKGRPCLERTRF